MSDTETDAVIDAAREAVDIGKRVNGLDLGNVADAIMVVTNEEGSATFGADIQHAIEERLPAPRRRKGAIEVHDMDSFVTAVNRWAVANSSVIYASIAKMSLTCIFNDHPAGPEGAAWRLEALRATFTAVPSPEWVRWNLKAGVDMSQEDFADFIDANLPDVTTVPGAEKGQYPSPIELLEMARNLQIYTRGTFERKIDSVTGSGTLVVKDEHETYSSKIWRAFPLALRVFEGGKAYLVEARIRFKVAGGRATFQYTLHRALEIQRDAFKEIREAVAKACDGVPVLAGTP